MIDKHAAHERIIFDELCRSMQASLAGKKSGGQLLMAPYEISLTSAEADVVGDYREKICALGFDFVLEETGVSSYKASITQIPEALDTLSAAELFSTLASKLSDMTASVESAAETFFQTRLWQASCKAAIKGGRIYDMGHIRWICDRLLKNPDEQNSVIRTCPHGRPVAMEMSKQNLDHQFERS
jgi:DNA mismatch repair protein MutL